MASKTSRACKCLSKCSSARWFTGFACFVGVFVFSAWSLACRGGREDCSLAAYALSVLAAGKNFFFCKKKKKVKKKVDGFVLLQKKTKVPLPRDSFV